MDIKKIVVVGFGFLATGLGVYKLLSGNEPQKYSSKWFETISDEILETEREVIRKQFCSAGDNFSLAVSLQNLLFRFDSELRNRSGEDKISYGPSYHREHGYNLFKEE